MKCVICEARKPRRYCPGVRGDICTICCGTERENTVDCPFDCVYLREARLREKPRELDEERVAEIPFADVRVPERFVREHQDLVLLVSRALVESVFSTAGAIDADLREALDALIRTHRTLQSGLVYETRPDNPVAGRIFIALQSSIAQLTKDAAERSGVSVRDADIMAALILFQRQAYRFDNGRKRGRAFMDYLRQSLPAETEAVKPAASSLII